MLLVPVLGRDLQLRYGARDEGFGGAGFEVAIWASGLVCLASFGKKG